MQKATEKRQQPRLYGAFSVHLHIANQAVEQQKSHTLADNVSQGGLYLQLPYALEAGTSLFLLINLPSGAKLAAFGQVLRTEPQNHTLFGLAIGFHRTRLLPAVAA
jgi:hypothetical protein